MIVSLKTDKEKGNNYPDFQIGDLRFTVTCIDDTPGDSSYTIELKQ
ncbi:UNVERIFIED_CONTAM: hypothetical protein O8I53_10285 [Campylobacter lari]